MNITLRFQTADTASECTVTRSGPGLYVYGAGPIPFGIESGGGVRDVAGSGVDGPDDDGSGGGSGGGAAMPVPINTARAPMRRSSLAVAAALVALVVGVATMGAMDTTSDAELDGSTIKTELTT